MFRIAVTRDLLTEDGPFFGAHWYDHLVPIDGVSVDFLPEYSSVIRDSELAGYDATIIWKPKLTKGALHPSLKLIARWGVGLDNVDVDACTANGTLVSITPDGVARPVAMANLLLMMALDANLLGKDEMVRTDRWGERLSVLGVGFTGKILGSIGFGNIARELFRLARPLEMQYQAYTPHPNSMDGNDVGAQWVGVDELLETSDVLCINCPLTGDTRGMIGATELAKMKPSALLINTARGAIVDEPALAHALRDGQIRGAGLDVFGTEPIRPDNPLLSAPNVILSPHATAWSEEMASRIAASVLESMKTVIAGAVPQHVINPTAVEHRLKFK